NSAQTGEKELVVGDHLPSLVNMRPYYSNPPLLSKGALHWLFGKFHLILHLKA
ncbi:hypothetical protein ACLOJK_002896, partial [Asimina triloba]